ncbi:MAG: protein kinase [Acidobacteria bacterium]|nr:protein kinase [Acidobacteriota bacterium]
MTHHGSGENQLMELRICPACRAVQAKGSSCEYCGKPLTLVNADYLAGWELGKYRLEHALGAGGMGMVYRASHSTLNKTVALKILLPRIESDTGEFARRFLREARVLAELRHPNIVEIYDMDVTEWGAPYFVMEHLEGLPLDELIFQYGGALPEPWIAGITKGLVSGLAFAHNRGIIHRDLKPENIFLSLYGKTVVPKILDFGIAKLISEHGDTTRLTSTGAVVGTPEYLTPEQVLNQEAGGWTDQYTLALVVAEMLSGNCPRAGKSLLEIVSTEIHHPLDLISIGIPVENPVANALYRATQPKPENRFNSVEDFLKALRLKHNESAMKKMTEWLVEAVSKTGSNTLKTVSGFNKTNSKFPPGSRQRVAAANPTRRLSSPVNSKQSLHPENDSLHHRLGWKLWGGFMLFTIIAIIIGWSHFSFTVIPSRPSTTPDKRIKKTYPVIKQTAKWNLPPDTRNILGQNEKEILIQGARGVYLLDNKTGKTATIPFPRESFFICGDNSIGAFLFKNGTLLHWNPKSDQTETVAAGLPPLDANEKIVSGIINPEHTRMLYSTNQKVRLLSFDQKTAKILYSRDTTGFTVLLAMGRKVAAAALPRGKIHVIHLKNGQIAATLHLNELRLYSLAISQPLHLIAVGGWFDKVYLLDYLHPDKIVTISQKGESHSVTWLGNGTTLAAGGIYGGFLWNRKDGRIGTIPVSQSGKLTQIFRGDGTILTLDENMKLSTFYFNRIPNGTAYRLGNNSIWAMCSGSTDHIFAGDSRGELYEFGKTGVYKTHSLHTLGIGALTSDGKFLATASDDKTIAVWQLPKMQVEWRSRAHKFLVTGLWLSPKNLWSVSSDGDIKKWSWPDLEPLEVIRISDIIKHRKTSGQSVWSSPDGKRVLVGSWDMGIIELEKKRGEYHWAHYQTNAKVIYQTAQVPGMNLVAFSAFNPYAAYLYDLEKGKLFKLPIYRATLMSLCSGRKGEIWYFGPGNIMRYQFSRDSAGIVHASISGGMESSMSIGISGCITSDKQHLVIGNETGEIFWWKISEIEKCIAPSVAIALESEITPRKRGSVVPIKENKI